MQLRSLSNRLRAAVESALNRAKVRQSTLITPQRQPIEMLESRQMLSFSSAILSAIYANSGNTLHYTILDSTGAAQATINYTTKGPQTLGQFSGDELETSVTATVNGNTISSVSDEFFQTADNGFIDEGGVTNTTTNGVLTSTLTTTYSPQKVLLPANLLAGQTQTLSYTETDVSTPAGQASSTSTTAVTETVSLASDSTQPVTVPAGTYNAYEVDLTDVDTPVGGDAGSPTLSEDFFASGIGLVKGVTGPLTAPTGTLELGSTNLTPTGGGGSGGGGSGGGGGTVTPGTGITPTLTKDTLPAAIVAGAKLHAALKLNLTDSLATVEKGYTVRVYASTTTTLDTTIDPLVTSVVKTSTIKAAKSAPLSIPITSLPATLPDGVYYLIAQTTDAAGNTDSVPTGTTITVAAPFTLLSETVTSPFSTALVGGIRGKGSVKLKITNGGNVTSTGVTPINLTFSTMSGVVGTSFATLDKKLVIPANKTITVAIPVKNIPVLIDGSYFVVAQVTDPNSGISIASSASSTTIAAPFVRLSVALGNIVNIKAGDSIVVTNGGNVVDTTHLSGTFAISLDVAGLNTVGPTATLTSAKVNIQPGKSIKLHVKPTKAFLADLIMGVPYYLTLTYTDGTTGVTGLAVSNAFTV